VSPRVKATLLFLADSEANGQAGRAL